MSDDEWREDGPGGALFRALPARVRQRLKLQPRTTRDGSGKARLSTSLDQQRAVKSFRRRKGRQGASPHHGRRGVASRPPLPSEAHVGAHNAGSPRYSAAFAGAGSGCGAGAGSGPFRPQSPAYASMDSRSDAAVAPSGPGGAVGPGTKHSHRSTHRRRFPRCDPAHTRTHTAWQRPGREREACADMFDALDREVADYVAYAADVAAASRPIVRAAIAHLRASVAATFPWSCVGVYGSFASGLWLPGSDVDLVALARTRADLDRATSAVYFLHRLAEVLRAQPWLRSLKVIASARMPVLKLTTTSGVDMDLTFAEGGTASSPTTALHNGMATLGVVRQLCRDLPLLKPLALVLKQLLREQGLNVPYEGGLSSYATVLMTAAFLQKVGHEDGLEAVVLDVLAARRRRVPLADETADQEVAEVLAAPLPASAKPTEGADLPPPDGACGPESAGVLGRAQTPGRSTCAPTPGGPYWLVDESEAAIGNGGGDSDTRARGVPPLTIDVDAKPAKGPCPSPSPSPTASLFPSLGVLLVRLLEFYGRQFRFEVFGLSVLDGGFCFDLPDAPPGLHAALRSVGSALGGGPVVVPPPSAPTPSFPGQTPRARTLILEDPLARGQNVAASSFRFAQVASVFEDCFYALSMFRPTTFTPTLLSSLLHRSGFDDPGYSIAPASGGASSGAASLVPLAMAGHKMDPACGASTKDEREPSVGPGLAQFPSPPAVPVS